MYFYNNLTNWYEKIVGFQLKLLIYYWKMWLFLFKRGKEFYLAMNFCLIIDFIVDLIPHGNLSLLIFHYSIIIQFYDRKLITQVRQLETYSTVLKFKGSTKICHLKQQFLTINFSLLIGFG